MFLDFWVASYLVQAGMRLRRTLGMRVPGASVPVLCRRVASGEPVSASSLLAARSFSLGAWLWATWACLLTFIAIAGIGSAFGAWRPGSPGHAVASDVLAAVLVLFAAVGGQFAVQGVRLAALVLYSRRAYARPDEILPQSASAGVPRRYDFWLSVPAALIMLAAILQPG